MRLKMFADGADKKEITRLNADERVSGFTTNPTLMRKAGVEDYLAYSREIAEMVAPKPISLEVIADTLDEMERQARLLDALGKNVYVKIPITTTNGTSTAELSRKLSHDGLKLNVTAIFTRAQVEETVDALTGGAPSVVSVFAGRIADAGVDPVPLMLDYSTLTTPHADMELLWASPREVLNVVQAEETGCQIITMTPDLWAKLPSIGKDLSQFSLETVQMFADDAAASQFKL